MSTTPPNKPRRRIAGEVKPGAVTKPPKSPKAPKIPKAPRIPKAPKIPKAPRIPKAPKIPKPAVGLPQAPPRFDAPTVPKAAGIRSLMAGSWVLVALTIGALVLAVTGGVAAASHFRGDDAGTTREDASDAAAVAAETVFTYQWNKLKQHLSDSKELMTPRFGKKFEDISPALSALAPQRRIQVKAVVRNAATVECGSNCADDKAKVLIFIDQARVADGADKPTMFGNRIEMTMVKRNGDWLVDDVKAL